MTHSKIDVLLRIRQLDTILNEEPHHRAETTTASQLLYKQDRDGYNISYILITTGFEQQY